MPSDEEDKEPVTKEKTPNEFGAAFDDPKHKKTKAKEADAE